MYGYKLIVHFIKEYFATLSSLYLSAREQSGSFPSILALCLHNETKPYLLRDFLLIFSYSNEINAQTLLCMWVIFLLTKTGSLMLLQSLLLHHQRITHNFDIMTLLPLPREGCSICVQVAWFICLVFRFQTMGCCNRYPCKYSLTHWSSSFHRRDFPEERFLGHICTDVAWGCLQDHSHLISHRLWRRHARLLTLQITQFAKPEFKSWFHQFPPVSSGIHRFTSLGLTGPHLSKEKKDRTYVMGQIWG